MSENGGKINGVEMVGHATEADEAMQSILKLNPDIVVLDLMLDKGNGMDVLQAIKKGPNSPIEMVHSNYTNTNNRKTCKELGAEHVRDKSLASTKR